MRTGCSAGCGVLLGMVTATGCAPFFTGEALAPPEGQARAEIYRGPAPVIAAEGVYGGTAPVEARSPPAAEAPQPSVVEVQSPAVEAPQPVVVFVRGPGCCPGPLRITVACAGGSGAPQEALSDQEAPPPAPYKPWPYEGVPAPRLYHDR